MYAIPSLAPNISSISGQGGTFLGTLWERTPRRQGFDEGFEYVWPDGPRRDLSLLSSEDHMPLSHSLWSLPHAHLSLQLSLSTSPSQQALGRGTRAGWGLMLLCMTCWSMLTLRQWLPSLKQQKQYINDLFWIL